MKGVRKTKSIYHFQDWDQEIITVYGTGIERFYLANGSIVRSEILYRGKDAADANNNLLKYWQPPKTWYVFDGRELHYC